MIYRFIKTFQPFCRFDDITAQLKPQATCSVQCTVHTVHCGIRYLRVSNEEVSRDHASGLYGATSADDMLKRLKWQNVFGLKIENILFLVTSSDERHSYWNKQEEKWKTFTVRIKDVNISKCGGFSTSRSLRKDRIRNIPQRKNRVAGALPLLSHSQPESLTSPLRLTEDTIMKTCNKDVLIHQSNTTEQNHKKQQWRKSKAKQQRAQKLFTQQNSKSPLQNYKLISLLAKLEEALPPVLLSEWEQRNLHLLET